MHKTFFILVGISILVFLVFGVSRFRIKSSETSVSAGPPITNSYFLQNIGKETVNMVLVIFDTDGKKYWIDDPEILKKYENILQIQRSLLNYLPGEGDQSKGLILLKDRSIIKSVQGAIFKKYELGDILTYAQKFEDVIETISVSAGKKELLEVYDFEKLRDDPQIYNLDIPEFPEDDLEYAFSLSLPSILLKQNNILEKEALEKSIFEKVSQEFKAFGEFSLPESFFISQSEGGIYLQDTKDDTYIQNREKQNIILEGYTLIQPQIYIRCSEAFYKKIQTLNFKKHFLAQKYSDVIRETALKNTLEKNNMPHISPNDVYIADWSDDVYLGELTKQEYTLSYWKLR